MNRQDVLKSMLARWRPEQGTSERPERMVNLAQDIIDRVTTQVLARGWWFNTEVISNIKPGEDGVIDLDAIPGCVIMAYGADDKPVTVKVESKCYVPPSTVVADFTSDLTSGEAPLTVVFTDLSTGDIVEWSWDFGNGSVSTDQHPTAIYASAGAYVVSLTVTGADGSTDTKTVEAYVTATGEPPPGPTSVDFTADITEGASPLEVDFTATETGGVNAWLWDFENNGSIDSTLQNPTKTYTTTSPKWFTPRLVGLRSADAVTAVRQRNGYISVTNTFDSPAAARSGLGSIVGLVVDGLEANGVYEITMPPGLTYAGFSGYATDGAAPGGLAWSNLLVATGGPGTSVSFDHPRSKQIGSDGHATAEAARAAFGTHTVTGYTEYSFWIFDNNPGDNRGGFSFLMRRIA